MSQQNPGQPGGQGGPPYGAGPGYPGGYGPGAGPVGGVGPGGYPYPGAAPYPGGPAQSGANKKKQIWIAAGIGCGLVVLLAIGGIIAALLWLRNRSNDFVSDVERQLSNASAAVAAASAQSAAGAGATVEPTGDCRTAYVCCRAIATKSTGNDAAVQACEVFKVAGYPQPSCAAALTGYRQVAKAVGVTCE